MTPPLKPCPFCGSAPEMKRVARYVTVIHCTDGDCGVSPEAAGEDERDLVNTWNRRAPSIEEGAARRHQEGRTT